MHSTKLPTINTDTATALLEAHGQTLAYGSYIPPETIEPILGIKRDHAQYSFGIMALRQSLEACVAALTGRHYMTRMSDGGIRVLTLSEAWKHGHNQISSKRTAMEVWHLRTSVCVDPYLAELDDNERRLYQQQQHHNARLLLAMKETDLRALPDPFEGE